LKKELLIRSKYPSTTDGEKLRILEVGIKIFKRLKVITLHYQKAAVSSFKDSSKFFHL